MNLSNGKGSMSTASSTAASWKSRGGDTVSDQFPAGLRVLVVDDDPTCLMILEKMLRTCRYEVTKCNRAETALSLLRDNKNGYDVVISDVHMPDMDGFKLLEHIGLEMDLPVIMMSADDGKDVVMKGVTHGACDYLIKPVRIEALKTIWQHVVRKRKIEWKDYEQSGSAEESGGPQKQPDYAEYSSSANEGNWKSAKRRKEEEEELEERDDTSALKKPRVVWSVELHQQFVAAVNQLGIDKAVPKKILELMNVPGLTRENVASHLQKYRLYLRRLSGVSQHQNNLNNSFISPQDTSFGPLSSLSGLDLQTLSQIPAQSLATLQAASLGRSTAKSRVPISVVDQRNLFSFENPKLRFGEGQQQSQQQHSSNSKQMNLLHGIPTSMEPKQLAHLHHSAQSLGTMNVPVNTNGIQSSPGNLLLMQMSMPQLREQILSESAANHVTRVSSSTGQPITTNTISGAVLPRSGLPDTGRGTGHNSVPQSNSYNFPLNSSAELVENSFTVGSTAGISAVTSNGSFQEELNANTEIKGSSGFMPSYDIFSDFQQNKTNEWELQNVGLTYNAPQQANLLQSNLDVGPTILAHQAFSAGQSNAGNRSLLDVCKPIYSSRDVMEQMTVRSAGQNLNTIYAENPVRVKAENISDANCQPTIFNEQFVQEDLMSALLKQQQGGIVPAENEFEFDGYSIDNVPV